VFVVIQHPLADVRQLIANNSGRITSPDWPNPTPNQQFIRGFGGVRARAPGEIIRCIGESRICDTHRAVRFTDIGTFQWESNGQRHRVEARNCFRRFYYDGYVTCKVETGVRTRPARLPIEKNGRIWKAILDGILGYIVGLPVAIRPDNPSAPTYPLLEAGDEIARTYLGATTKAAFNLAQIQHWWVTSLAPLIFIETRGADQQWPDARRKSVLIDVRGMTLSHFNTFTTSLNFRPCRTWLLELSHGYKEEMARAIRISLLRVHAEQQCLDHVLNLIRRDQLCIQPSSIQESKLAWYFNYSTRRLLRAENRLKSIGGSEIIEFARSIDDDANPGEIAGVENKCDQVLARFPNIQQKVRAYMGTQRSHLSVVIKEFNMTKNVAKATGQGGIAAAGSELHDVRTQIGTFSSLADGEKQKLIELTNAFHLELDKLRSADAAMGGLVEKRFKEVLDAAAQPKEKRDRGVFALSAKGLTDAATAVVSIVPTLLPIAKNIATFLLSLVST
jgi:hypothetical protein